MENLKSSSSRGSKIFVTAPRQGTCMVCGAHHAAHEPHEYRSLYYMVKYRQTHGRYPSPEDAGEHIGTKGAATATMMWNGRTKKSPTCDDGDRNGLLLAWHQFHGTMLARWDEFAGNSFHTHWMRLSDLDGIPWVDAADKPPTKEDCDHENCVLGRTKDGELRITGWHQFGAGSMLTEWKRLPFAPETAK